MKTNEKKTFQLNQNLPVDIGRKLNVHKTFRRRPGPLLNVLCTFNLRPVSTGLFNFEKKDREKDHVSYSWYVT